MKKAILAGCLAAVLLVGLSPLLLQSEAVKLAEPEPEAVSEAAVNATLSPDPDAAAVSSGWDAGETLTVLVDGFLPHKRRPVRQKADPIVMSDLGMNDLLCQALA